MKRKNIYILAVVISVALVITQNHIEVEHYENKKNPDIYNAITEEYKETTVHVAPKDWTRQSIYGKVGVVCRF